MSDNVQDAFGPVLQRIQTELVAISAKLQDHDARFDGIDRRLDGLDRQLTVSRAQVLHAYGLASEATRVSGSANDDVDDVNRRLAELAARVEALESR